MPFAYRKHIERIDNEWHFHPDCQLWPQADYIEISSPPIHTSERLCMECVRLESTIPREK